MLPILAKLLAGNDYIPHGYCMLWQPKLLWLHVFSDSAIAIAYYTIPFALVYLVAKRQDLGHPDPCRHGPAGDKDEGMSVRRSCLQVVQGDAAAGLEEMVGDSERQRK